MGFDGRESAEDRLIETRWHGSPSCPSCGSRRLSDREIPDTAKWSRWRCCGCRRRFSVTSGTAIHSTKLGPSEWVAAADLGVLTPSSVAEAIGVSQVTARKIAALLQPVRSGPPAARLKHLMSGRRRKQPNKDPWQIESLPATFRHEDSPLPSMSPGAKSVLNALRARPFGATASKVAELAGMSYSQTLRCLADLKREDCVTKSKTSIQIGYELRLATMWSLSWSDRCMHALAFLRDVPTRSVADSDDRIPQRYWRSFWSGASADALRISEHGLHIAETLIGGRDPCARAWALSALPTEVLRECRSLRGFDAGLVSEQLDSEICRRKAPT